MTSENGKDWEHNCRLFLRKFLAVFKYWCKPFIPDVASRDDNANLLRRVRNQYIF